MATISSRPTLKTFIVIELSEEEAGALDAIVGYGTDAFLKAFYAELGESYLKKYESGLRSLFTSVRTGDASVKSFLQRAAEARAVLNGTHTATRKDDSK